MQKMSKIEDDVRKIIEDVLEKILENREIEIIGIVHNPIGRAESMHSERTTTTYKIKSFIDGEVEQFNDNASTQWRDERFAEIEITVTETRSLVDIRTGNIEY